MDASTGTHSFYKNNARSLHFEAATATEHSTAQQWLMSSPVQMQVSTPVPQTPATADRTHADETTRTLKPSDEELPPLPTEPPANFPEQCAKWMMQLTDEQMKRVCPPPPVQLPSPPPAPARAPPLPAATIPPPATKHSILLHPDEAHTQMLEARTQYAPGVLHRLARAALDGIANAGPERPHGDLPFPWQSYVACHVQAADIIGSGIVRAAAEFITTTQDPNRYGQPRLDFVFYRADGSYCRLHPGSRRQGDAKPVFIACSHATELPASSSGHVTEQPASAEQQWRTLHGRIVTLEFAAAIPQIDRIGKQQALRALQTLCLGPLPTDALAAFKWWLFVCNLGHKTSGIIGRGIVSAELAEKWNNGVILLFHRQDGTQVRLEIQQPERRSCSTRIL